MKNLVCVLYALLLTACVSSPTAKFDYNEKIDFSLFKNFHFIEHINNRVDANPVMDAHIEQAIKSALTRNFLTHKSEFADLQIKFHFSQQEKINNSSLSIGLGRGKIGGRGAASLGLSTNIPLKTDVTMLTKIFIDISHNNQAIWHGNDIFENKDEMPVKEKKQAITATVNRLLLNFPPQKIEIRELPYQSLPSDNELTSPQMGSYRDKTQ